MPSVLSAPRGAIWMHTTAEPITLRMVAERLRVSEYYLAHVFKQEFGVPPMQYVMKRRIGEAQGFLMNTSIPIAEIADTPRLPAVSVTSTPCLRSTPAHRPASSGSHSSRASRTAKKEKSEEKES